MAQPRILVAEPSAPIAAAVKKFLHGWAEVQVVSYFDEAVQLVRARPPDVLIAAVNETFDGELLAPQVRKQAPETAVVLAYPASEVERAHDRAREAGADGFVVGPLKKHHVLGVVQAVTRLNTLAAQLKQLQAKFEELKKKQLIKAAPSPVGLNAPDEAFFKKYMLLEVKRSKRYQYPLAILLVSLDNLKASLGESAPEFQLAAIRSESLEVLSALLRDIDVAMPFAEDKYLLFLPHTPLKGATVVAERVVQKLKTLETFPNGTVSIGVANYDPTANKDSKEKEQVSFGGLVREASSALKRAQEAGGDRFDAPMLAKPKKNRISMG
ncbi:MAG: diguanylate cyclase domain-containing protein [Archangium sp.]